MTRRQRTLAPFDAGIFDFDRMSETQPICCEALADAGNGFAHGFFTRQGGVSTGIYAGLNVGLGSQDDPDAVRQNRQIALSLLDLDGADLVTPHQVHSAHATIVDAPWEPDKRPTADAVVTGHAGIVLGILTADCGPVLFCDPRNRIVAAAHAGWRGALDGILENTIEAMEVIGANRRNIVATLGPSISRDNYEVGAEFQNRFAAANAAYTQFFTPSDRPGHFRFDLPAFIGERLKAAGASFRWTGDCTYADPNRFYSYRRATHRNEPDYGRQLSAIAIRM